MAKSSTWKHFAAFIYDIFPLLGVLIITSLLVLVFRSGQELQRHTTWFTVLIFIEISFYYIYSWKVGGQTLGMRAWKMKIIPDDPKQITLTWAQAITRFVVGILSTALIGLGLFWKLFSENQKSWMDMASNSTTIVNK